MLFIITMKTTIAVTNDTLQRFKKYKVKAQSQVGEELTDDETLQGLLSEVGQ